ncbi:MAG: HAD-IIA family hydrolase [Eubacteriales bacterium]|jgi:NagD protein|nr:HAD family hydrolase [Clostridiales bacterium]
MSGKYEELRAKAAFICDMDGVIYHGNKLLPDVPEFVRWLADNNKKYLFLTNNSERSPRELAQKLARMGLDVGEEHFYTSALATASFLASQCPGGSVYVVGEPGLVNALYDAGFSMNDIDPDYVVFGETRSLSYEKIEKAVKLVQRGAKLIGTNSDLTGPSENGIIPACRALIAPIELSTGKQAYYIGKPNPLIMRHALRTLGCDPADAVIIGDRMDTDIVAGIESELDTVLVLSGVTDLDMIKNFSYRPKYVMNGVGDLLRD